MRAATQKAEVLARLFENPAVCSTSLLRAGIPRAAARVYELRRAGWQIETRPCSQHRHHTRQVEYLLRRSR